MNIKRFYNNLKLQVIKAKTVKALQVIQGIGERYIISLPKTTASNIVNQAKLEQKKLVSFISKKMKKLK